MPSPQRRSPAPSPAATASASMSTTKSQRVLACILCQRRKLRCDRQFPCANCTKSHAQCVPAATLPPRQRRRRFPERELLDRLHRYEGLLREKNISFEPLHKESTALEKGSRGVNERNDGNDGNDGNGKSEAVFIRDRSTSPSSASRSESVYKVKNLWQAMNQRSDFSDEESIDSSPGIVSGAVIQDAWEPLYQSNGRLLFGARKAAIDLSALHPEQVQVFKLWQVYLDNINPLLKVTHTPSLQGRIVDAASNITSVEPVLAALMFGIYCASVMSLTGGECRAMLGSPKDELLARYHFGCEQALFECDFMRSSDRESLTALHLYLISLMPGTDPQSLSSILGVAIRIAQRMGLHCETAHAKCTPFEAEMRRRLWWSLVIFDTRVCELAGNTFGTMLNPTWDCATPLNVNDFDLQPEMKVPPSVQGRYTEALFTVVRSELSDCVRHSDFHLDFTIPPLKNVAKDVLRDSISKIGELGTVERMIEEKFLKDCDPENPFHFVTIWMARYHFARNRLIENFSRFSSSPIKQTDAHRDDGISCSLAMLKCDTKLMTSPHSKGHQWLIAVWFPFPAYIQLVQDLKKRPTSDHAEETWEIISDNYEAHFKHAEESVSPFLRVFAKFILRAWEAREVLFNQSHESPLPPRAVLHLRQKVAQLTQDTQHVRSKSVEEPGGVLDMSIDNFPPSIPIDIGGHGMLFGMVETEDRQAALNVNINHIDWNTMTWDAMQDIRW